MDSMFNSGGFRPFNPFSAAGFQNGPRLGARQLGEPLTRAQIESYERKIADGKRKLAQVRAWIATRIDQDPMLRRTFGQEYISDNFWGYMDLIQKDQWYVDQTEEAIRNPSTSDYDIPTENLARTDEWAQVIDIVYAAMQEYGGVRPGQVPVTRPGTPSLQTPPPTSGIGTNEILVGGAVLVGLGVLVAVLT